MLTYTFSTREKIMLGVLAIVGVLVLWYQLIFSNIQTQLADIESQIAVAEETYTTTQQRATQLASMRATIDNYQSQGLVATLLPSYDNTQNLMAYLNGVLMGTSEYNMSFETPSLSEEDSTIHRSGTISFTTGSYAEARSVIENIAHGPYPCEIQSFGITDNTALSDAAVSSSVQVTFFEKPTADMKASSDDSIPEGNDLSVYKDLT